MDGRSTSWQKISALCLQPEVSHGVLVATLDVLGE